MKLKSLLDYPANQPMSVVVGESFARLVLIEMSGNEPEELKALTSTDPVCRIVRDRINSNVTVSDCVAVLASLLCEGNPGKAVTWAYTLVDLADREKVPHIDLLLLLRYFQKGFPSEESMHDCWKQQKIGGWNAYDSPEYWETGSETKSEKGTDNE